MNRACATCAKQDTCFYSSEKVIDCTHHEPKSETNHERLFGTPERAARTLGIIADNLYSSTWSDDNATLSDVMCALVGKCDECVAQGLPGRGVTTKCGEVDYDALLEWLRGEA